MKKLFILLCILTLVFGLGLSASYAAPPFENQCANGVDDDGDGLVDCDDPDCDGDPDCSSSCTISEDPEATCDDAVDNDCDGLVDCDDSDCDGNSACSTTCTCSTIGDDDTCNACSNCEWIGNPAQGSCEDTCTVTEDPEVSCTDGVDNDCDGLTDADDSDCGSSDPHANLTWADWMADPPVCMDCHNNGGSDDEYADMSGSVHYQWEGSAPDMVNGGNTQGKLDTSPGSAVNSYCINILGDWPVCGSCHIGRGKKPTDSTAGVENIDCLMCHSEEYATQRVRLSDGTMGVENPTDTMVQNVHPPKRVNCLMCHAKAGGGDGVKRGDLSLATIDNNSATFDVHMNTAASDLACQSCHTAPYATGAYNHKVIGKGSDLRPTDGASEVACTTCHAGKDSSTGHTTTKINDHVARTACQTCHIPTYAKVATEIDRDWRVHADGTDATTCTSTNPCPGHPSTVKASNLIPKYKFWDRTSDNALLGDSEALDTATGCYPTSRPVGDIAGALGNKLSPFKYKVAQQPIMDTGNVMIALDTFEYLKGSGNIDTAIENGLQNMGYSTSEPYHWNCTDTYQLLNHGIDPASGVLDCTNCHENTSQMDLINDIGYAKKAPLSEICIQCHGEKDYKGYDAHHSRHVDDKGYDCTCCHNFSRPERGLNTTCE